MKESPKTEAKSAQRTVNEPCPGEQRAALLRRGMQQIPPRPPPPVTIVAGGKQFSGSSFSEKGLHVQGWGEGTCGESFLHHHQFGSTLSNSGGVFICIPNQYEEEERREKRLF